MNNLKAQCPVCDAQISLGQDTQVSEIISCTDCKTQLVVESVSVDKANLIEAPKIEEDWGE